MSEEDALERKRRIKREYMARYRARRSEGYLNLLAEQRRKRTGFTDELYEQRLAEQGGMCAICGDDGTEGRWQALHRDHNHDTMQPRGLLCSRCNTALGLFLEDPARLRSAINYLERWNADAAPDELEETS